jgi:hypothetical protein
VRGETVLNLDLIEDEVDLVLALLVDRKLRSENLAKNSASRTTRHARAFELTILERIANKLGGWPPEEEPSSEVEAEGEPAPAAHDDEKDLQEGRLFTEPPAKVGATKAPRRPRLAADE